MENRIAYQRDERADNPMTSYPTIDQRNGSSQDLKYFKSGEFGGIIFRLGCAPRPVVPTNRYVPKYFAKVKNGRAWIYRNSGIYFRTVGHKAALVWVLKGDIVRVMNDSLQSSYYDIESGVEIIYEDSPKEPPSIPMEKMVGVFGYIHSQVTQYH